MSTWYEQEHPEEVQEVRLALAIVSTSGWKMFNCFSEQEIAQNEVEDRQRKIAEMEEAIKTMRTEIVSIKTTYGM